MKRLAALALFIAGLATLIGLGTWQVQRLQWKNTLIAELEAQYAHLPAKSAILTRGRMDAALAREDRPFLVDKASGRFLQDKLTFIGPRPRESKIGYEVIAPLQIDEGILLVNLGWVAQEDKDTLALPQRVVVLNGIARRPDYSPFTSANSPANDLWFQADIAQIAQSRGLENTAPMIFYAQDSTPALQHIILHDAHWLPRNKHRQYMLFWFGMAAAWMAVFALAWRRYRQG